MGYCLFGQSLNYVLPFNLKCYLQPSDGGQDSCGNRRFLQFHRTHMRLLDRIQQVSANWQPARGNPASQLVESYSGHLPVYRERYLAFLAASTASGRTVENAVLQ